MPSETLAARVRAKYPGAYDDLDDATLERQVRAKFPGVYDDLPSTGAAPTPAPTPTQAQAPQTRAAAALVDAVTGVAKGVGNTVVGLGEAAYNYIPGVAAVSDATQRALFGDVQPAGPLFAGARQSVQPTTTAQQLGYTAEQIGEYFVPATRAARFVRPAEAVKAGVTALAQSGDPTTAGVSGGLAAVVPGAGAVRRTSDALARSAEKSVAGALGATKEWAKAEAAELAPEMLRRGVRGGRAEMLAQARTQTQRVGADIGQEIQRAAAAGTTIPGATILQTLTAAQQGLTITTAGGRTLPIAGTEPVAPATGPPADLRRAARPRHSDRPGGENQDGVGPDCQQGRALRPEGASLRDR